MSANGSEGQFLPSLIDAMMMVEFYPHHPTDVELRETHISYVFLAGEYAYKIKKPVQLPFVDCSTLAKRFELCQREALLNRRLAPEVYVGVVPIMLRNGVFTLGGTSGGTAVEFAAKMRRLPDERRLDNLIAAEKVSAGDVQAVAKRVAEFHVAAARAEAWRYGAAAAVWQLVVGNISETEGLLADTVSADKLKVIESYVRQYISSHWRFLNMRARNGHVLDGHGDLRSDAVYLTKQGIAIIDCLEFSDALRYCDVASEVSFLAMDLDRLERPMLSAQFVRSYIEATKDEDLPILLPFYKCHRALVRAKVELIASRQGERPATERMVCREKARHYLDLACGYANTSPKPGVIVVCGPSGTGKSTVARELRDLLGFEIVSSDSERKHLAGIAPTTRIEVPYGRGIYSQDFGRKVYGVLEQVATQALAAGKGIIIDATFRHRAEREQFAAQFGMEPFYVECQADRDEVVRRLLARASRPNHISDATVEIYLRQLKEFEPLDEIPPTHHIVVDTTRDLTAKMAEVERRFR
jgi:uncharacterized protein